MTTRRLQVLSWALLFLSPLFLPVFVLLTYVRARGDRSQRILVIPQLTRVGDLVCATPVFRSLKKQFPGVHVTVLISKKVGGILKNNPRVDEVLYLEDYKQSFLALVVLVAWKRFDIGISLSGTFFANILCFYGCIPLRVKLKQRHIPWGERFSNWMTNVKVAYEEGEYIPDFYAKLLAPIGVMSYEALKEVFVRDEDRKVISHLLSEAPTELLVGLSLSAGNAVKEWGDDRFFKLAEALIADYGATILVIGGQNECERIDAFIARSNHQDRYIKACTCTLEELPALMERLDLYVAVDTGPIHIAHALKVPLIDIVGPVNYTELSPRGERCVLVKPDPPVEPTIFAFREPGDPSLTKRALDNTQSLRVLESAITLLKETGILYGRS